MNKRMVAAVSGTALLLAALTAATAATGDAPSPTPDRTVDAGRLGAIRLYLPSDVHPKGLVYLVSDAAGWTDELGTAAREAARDGRVVAGVDLPTVLAALRASADTCHYLVSDFEVESYKLQRDLAFAAYASPIVAGVGEGGALSYAALAQAPAATLAGAISIAPSGSIDTKVPFCPGAPSTPAASGFSYGAYGTLPGWWRVVEDNPSDALSALVAQSHGAFAPGDPAHSTVAPLLVRTLDGKPLDDAEATVAALPLVELPGDTSNGLLAIVYSGDGGWRDLDKTIAEKLQQQGVSVVGVDSLRYFWETQSPGQIAHDLAAVIHHYQKAWGSKQVALVGYSFGANILPFAYNALPADVQKSVTQMSLLGLAERTDFEIRVTGWLGMSPPDDSPLVLPELAKIDPHLIQCFYGVQEDDTACTDPAMARAQLVKTEGGHHFDGDYGRLADVILDGMKERATVVAG
jgi:type IV secretory pathway VirJ component